MPSRRWLSHFSEKDVQRFFFYCHHNSVLLASIHDIGNRFVVWSFNTFTSKYIYFSIQFSIISCYISFFELLYASYYYGSPIVIVIESSMWNNIFKLKRFHEIIYFEIKIVNFFLPLEWWYILPIIWIIDTENSLEYLQSNKIKEN